MLLNFYFFSILTIMFTVLCIIQKNAVYSLFYLSSSILSTAAIFFLLGNYFIASFHIIIYSGSIIVLFIFVIMLFNLDILQKNTLNILNNYFYFICIIIFFSIMFMLFYNIFMPFKNYYITIVSVNLKLLGINLFGPYIVIVEFISILLLSALITIMLIYRNKNYVVKNKFNN